MKQLIKRIVILCCLMLGQSQAVMGNANLRLARNLLLPTVHATAYFYLNRYKSPTVANIYSTLFNIAECILEPQKQTKLELFRKAMPLAHLTLDYIQPRISNTSLVEKARYATFLPKLLQNSVQSYQAHRQAKGFYATIRPWLNLTAILNMHRHTDFNNHIDHSIPLNVFNAGLKAYLQKLVEWPFDAHDTSWEDLNLIFILLRNLAIRPINKMTDYLHCQLLAREIDATLQTGKFDPCGIILSSREENMKKMVQYKLVQNKISELLKAKKSISKDILSFLYTYERTKSIAFSYYSSILQCDEAVNPIELTNFIHQLTYMALMHLNFDRDINRQILNTEVTEELTLHDYLTSIINTTQLNRPNNFETFKKFAKKMLCDTLLSLLLS